MNGLFQFVEKFIDMILPFHKVVYEPPRRLFVHLPETSVAVADYLLLGTEDCLANIKEVFGVEVAEDQIEGGRQIPMVGYALYAVLAVSAGVAYMSIGGW